MASIIPFLQLIATFTKRGKLCRQRITAFFNNHFSCNIGISTCWEAWREAGRSQKEPDRMMAYNGIQKENLLINDSGSFTESSAKVNAVT